MPEKRTLTVAVGGLGAIGFKVAHALDQGIDGLALLSVAVRDPEAARQKLSSFKKPPQLVALDALAEADIVVEALPSSAFRNAVAPAVARGRTIIVASCGALIAHPDLMQEAARTGARLVIPSGALAGLDAVRAMACGSIQSARIETRKPPMSLTGVPYLMERGIEVEHLQDGKQVFAGTVREAIAAFPANTNVAAALALAGIGPDRTRAEVWADPAVTRNTHIVHIESDMAQLKTKIEIIPDADNPRTSQLAPYSILASLRNMVGSLVIAG